MRFERFSVNPIRNKMRRKPILLFLLLLAGSLMPLRAQQPICLYGPDSLAGVTLTPYVAHNNASSGVKPGTAVIVCPGGSYCWLDYQGEGVEVAQWLQQQGITAFVLKYRVAGWWAWFTHYRWLFRGNQYPDPQNDAATAVQWVRDNAAYYGVDPDQIGIMGFSAGGHLAMSTSIIMHQAGKPLAFAAPIYPVVTMQQDCVHKRSRRGLLGESGRFNNAMKTAASLEQQVVPGLPPTFLVNCIDDPIVDYHNSMLLDSALSACNVPHRYIQYRTGGHGFGVSEERGTPECRPWKQEFLLWLRNLD